MFFRNLSLFRFSPSVADDLARLPELLPLHALRPCGPQEFATRGFIPPAGRAPEASFTLHSHAFTGFAVGAQEKLLPAAVINDALQAKVREIADQEGRRVGGRERKRVREDLLAEMLPKAFVRGSILRGYVDTAMGWLVLDTASVKAAENAVNMLREALGSFPAVPLAPEEGPRVLLTDWLARGDLPEGLALGDECELRDPSSASGAIWRGRRQDLDAEEVKEHLRSGKQVTRLGLVFRDRLSFVLGDDLVIRKLQLLDVVLDELDSSHEDSASEALATFTLFTLEIDRLLAKLADWFGLPRPADA